MNKAAALSAGLLFFGSGALAQPRGLASAPPGAASIRVGGPLRYLGGVASGICAVTAAGANPVFCADFANGIYVLNGTTYPSFTAMGGSFSGCTVSPGTGISCTGMAVLPNANPSAFGYMLVTNAVRPAGTAYGTASQIHQSGSILVPDQSNGSGGCYAYFNGGAAVTSGSTGSTGENAIYVSGNNALSVSFGGSAVLNNNPNSGGVTPAANSNLEIADGYTGGNYVSSVRIYVGTFTNAQVQLAATQ